MKKKVAINFTVSSDDDNRDNADVARILHDGVVIDNEGLHILKRKDLIFYAVKFFHKWKNGGVSQVSTVKPVDPVWDEPDDVEISPASKGGLGALGLDGFAKKVSK